MELRFKARAWRRAPQGLWCSSAPLRRSVGTLPTYRGSVEGSEHANHLWPLISWSGSARLVGHEAS